MKHSLIIGLPYLLSVITAWGMYLAGNKNSKAWLIGLLNQVLWLTWITLSGTWGLLPMTGVMVFVYIRNYLKWKKQDVQTN